MSFYSKDSTLTFEWVIRPNASPPAKADLDIKLQLPDRSTTYTNDGVLTYVAPTATAQGSATYELTPTVVGRYQVTLSIGGDTEYIVKSFREIYVVVPPDHVLNGCTGKTTLGPEVTPPKQFADPLVSNWTDIYQITCAISNGSKIVFFAKSTTQPSGAFWSTDHVLTQPTLLATGASLPTPVSFGNVYDRIVYSPKHDRWVARYQDSATGLIYSDDDGVNWAEATTPLTITQPGMVYYNEVLELFYTGGNGSDILVSTDGITWVAQATLEVLGGTHPGRLYDARVLRVGNDNIHVLSQWEEYAYKYNDDAGGSTGWTKTPNQGVIGGGGTWDLHNWTTDGSIIVVTAFGYQAHTGLLSEFSNWTEYNFTTLNWSANSSPSATHNCLAYIPEFSRPWIVCIDDAADAKWYDATDPTIPDYQVSTNPFFAGKAPMRASKWNLPAGYLNTFDGYWLGIFNNQDFDGSDDQIILGLN